MDIVSLSRDTGIRGLVLDHDSGIALCALAQSMEDRCFSAFGSLRKRCWLLRSIWPIASILGFNQGTRVHHLSDHLSFSRGYKLPALEFIC